jgi:hypothetical protein
MWLNIPFFPYPSVINDVVITYNSTAAADDKIENNTKQARYRPLHELGVPSKV